MKEITEKEMQLAISSCLLDSGETMILNVGVPKGDADYLSKGSRPAPSQYQEDPT